MITIWKYCNKIIKSIKISMYTYVIIYIYICNHENNDVSTQFSPQWFCGNSCIWADRALCVQVHELPQSHCDDNQESSLFSWLPICYAHLASERFEHFMFCGSLMTTYILYIYILYIYILYIYILYIYIYIHMKYNTQK